MRETVMIGIRKPRWAEKLDGKSTPKVYPEQLC
jgi:hypothetical protein